MRQLTILSTMLILLSLLSCRPEENPAKQKPRADSFSPGISKTGDTIEVIGSGLSGAKILLEGKEVELLKSENNFLSFIVKESMSALKSDLCLTVQFQDNSTTSFSQRLIVNHKISGEDLLPGNWLGGKIKTDLNLVEGDTLMGPKQLIITDFDGHGIRMADATIKFDETQFTALVKTGGKILITNSFLNGEPSPVGENYFVTQLSPEYIEEGKYGFAAELVSNTDFMNDLERTWPISFVDTPNGPLDAATSNPALSTYYFNFFIFKNGNEKGFVRPYLFSDDLTGNAMFANNFSTTLGNNEWEIVSIPVREFKTTHGTSVRMNFNNFKSLNKIKFNVAHLDLDQNQMKPSEAEGEVLIYIDHITITQGAPFVYKKF